MIPVSFESPSGLEVEVEILPVSFPAYQCETLMMYRDTDLEVVN